MNDETLVPETEVQDTVPVESVTQEIEAPVIETDDGSVTGTEAITVVDYTPVIYEVGNGIAATQLFCVFLIAGILIIFKIFEVKFNGS